MAKNLQSENQITGMAPFVQGQALLSTNNGSAFAMVEGVDPALESQVLPIASKMQQGSLSALKPGQFGIVLGKDLAFSLGLSVGSTVTVVIPQGSLSPAGIMPRLKQFKVVGIFSVGYQYDTSTALINLTDAQKLFMLGNAVSGLQLRLTNLYQAPAFAQLLQQKLPLYQVYDWTMQNENFFKALKMEKTMMFLILVLIIAIAAFNMLASLVMVVTDKQADIAILRTLGLSAAAIMRIFIVQGTVVGIFGTLLGLIFGLTLAYHVTEIVNFVQQLFHVQFLSASVYYIDFVPSQVDYADVAKICGVAVLLSLLATLYPAWRAANVQPAEALRYE
jgi:lipoprotein-releasing system permease protein